mmetsp:Transcript_5938/g.7340  ORF Transcript_5938/g.7340 Transcript_5938/m.7340 type:complete len:228 (-) Transcript_5938:279-962(-)
MAIALEPSLTLPSPLRARRHAFQGAESSLHCHHSEDTYWGARSDVGERSRVADRVASNQGGSFHGGDEHRSRQLGVATQCILPFLVSVVLAPCGDRNHHAEIPRALPPEAKGKEKGGGIGLRADPADPADPLEASLVRGKDNFHDQPGAFVPSPPLAEDVGRCVRNLVVLELRVEASTALLLVQAVQAAQAAQAVQAVQAAVERCDDGMRERGNNRVVVARNYTRIQ